MNVYGRRQDYKGKYVSVILKMLDAIENNQPPTIFGNGEESYDFVSVEDCARANVCAIKSSAVNEFYNVGTGVKTSLKELAHILMKIKNRNLLIKYIKNKEKFIDRNRVGSTKKAKKDLGFKSRISINDGLKDLIDWKDKEFQKSK